MPEERVMRWINREKLVFVGSGAALCLAAAYSVVLQPSIGKTGKHRVTIGVPESIGVELRVDMGDPAGPNPFAPYVKRSVIEGKVKDGVAVNNDNGDGDVKENIVPPPPDLDTTSKQEEKGTEKVVDVRPYDVPANFRGVHRPSGGKWRVILEDKRSRRLRTFFEGDVWPSLKLRILRITSNSVLLRNDEGKRFLMRDLYGQRSRKSHGDSARAGLQD